VSALRVAGTRTTAALSTAALFAAAASVNSAWNAFHFCEPGSVSYTRSSIKTLAIRNHTAVFTPGDSLVACKRILE
jgi:hypothetical protein